MSGVECASMIVTWCCFCVRLRLRLKAMQQVVDAQSERLALYQSEKDILNMSHQDHSTGQGEYVHVDKWTD